MVSLHELNNLYDEVNDKQLTKISGGRRHLPKWTKYVEGVSGIIGELAEPGSVRWSRRRHRR